MLRLNDNVRVSNPHPDMAKWKDRTGKITSFLTGPRPAIRVNIDGNIIPFLATELQPVQETVMVDDVVVSARHFDMMENQGKVADVRRDTIITGKSGAFLHEKANVVVDESLPSNVSYRMIDRERHYPEGLRFNVEGTKGEFEYPFLVLKPEQVPGVYQNLGNFGSGIKIDRIEMDGKPIYDTSSFQKAMEQGQGPQFCRDFANGMIDHGGNVVLHPHQERLFKGEPMASGGLRFTPANQQDAPEPPKLIQDTIRGWNEADPRVTPKPPEPPKADPVNPSHYKSGGFEVIDVIEAFKLGFNLGNALKYILRHRAKGGLTDLKKARWYLDREIERREEEGGD